MLVVSTNMLVLSKKKIYTSWTNLQIYEHKQRNVWCIQAT